MDPDMQTRITTQGNKHLYCFIYPLIDPMFTKHFNPDKHQHNGNTLLQVIEFADCSAQQEEK